MNDGPQGTADHQELAKRRAAIRLSTVYGGRISQLGKAYECTIFDVSAGGAKIKFKDPRDFAKILPDQQVQLVFERLSDYKALNGDVAWVKPDEYVIGMSFTDPELRRRVVIKRLMPNRWRIANELAARDDEHTPDSEAAEPSRE